jgi:hypothetical protein
MHNACRPCAYYSTLSVYAMHTRSHAVVRVLHSSAFISICCWLVCATSIMLSIQYWIYTNSMLNVYRISGNIFWRIFTNFTVWEPPANVFSLKFSRACPTHIIIIRLIHRNFTDPWKFSPSNVTLLYSRSLRPVLYSCHDIIFLQTSMNVLYQRPMIALNCAIIPLDLISASVWRAILNHQILQIATVYLINSIFYSYRKLIMMG